MAEADNFEQLLEDQPKEAIKYLKELIENSAWIHYQQKLLKELDACDEDLRSCSLDKVLFVRGYRKGIEYASGVLVEMIAQLEDMIALQKDAEKVEAARQND